MPSKYVLASNWKAGINDFYEAQKWLDNISQFTNTIQNTTIIASIPYVYLSLTKSNDKFWVFSQNVSFVKKGAYTGEVTVDMLKSIQVKGSLVGHSERRNLFNEDDNIINQKVLLLQEKDIYIILCIGETLQDRKAGKTEEVLYNQITTNLKGFEKFNLLIVAYEPVWAIGTGIPIQITDLQKAEEFIRKVFKTKFSQDIILLYGGSVDKDFIKLIRKETTLNGALVGTASWNYTEFIKIIENFIND